MSTQATPIILGQRLGPRREESATSDLQNLLSKVLAVLLLRKWYFITPLLSALLLSFTVSLFMPRRYTVNAILERRDDDVITKLVTTRTPYKFETFRRSLQIDMCGYNAMSLALEQLGLTRQYPRDAEGRLTNQGRHLEQDLIGGLTQHINVGIMDESTYLDMIDIRYVGANPELGVNLITRLKNNYTESIRKRIQEQLTLSHDYFQKQVQKAKEQTARMEMELSDLCKNHPGVDPLSQGQFDEMLKNVEERLLELTRKRKETLGHIRVHEEYLNELEGKKSGNKNGPATRPAALAIGWAANPEHQTLRQEIEGVRRRIDEEKTVHGRTDFHPAVRALYANLQLLEGRLATLPEKVETAQNYSLSPNNDGLNPLEAEHGRVQMQLKALGGTMQGLDEEFGKCQARKQYLDKEKELLPDRRHRYLILEKDLTSVQNDLTIYKQQLEEIGRVLKADRDDHGIHFTTVMDAQVPVKPSSPALKGVFFLSAVISLALAVAATFFREMFDRSMRDPEQARASLGIPILETIGEISVPRRGAAALRGRLLILLAAGEATAILVMAFLVYCSLEQPILFSRITAGLKMLMPG